MRKNNESIYVPPSKAGSQLFPAMYKTVANTHVTLNPGSSSSYFNGYTFKGNSFNLPGPQVNWTGAFGSNVPSGLLYLLSANTVGGANAPYGKYRIKSSKISLTVATNNAIGNVPIYCIIIPSKNSSINGMSLTQMEEQPYAKKLLLPSATTKPMYISHAMSSLKIFGDLYKSQLEDNSFEATATTDPTNLWYWHVYFVAANATTNIDLYCDARLSYAVDFIERNNYTTTTPS